MGTRSSQSWQQSKAEKAGYVYRSGAANVPIRFCRKLIRHSKGHWAGQPFELTDYQLDTVIKPLYGWVHSVTGHRLYNRVYIEWPKKQGKSTMAAAAIGLPQLFEAPGAEVYSTATKKDQAAIVHQEAVTMVESSPELSKHLTINRTNRNIAYPEKASWYRALSADGGGAEGINPVCVIKDEMHVWKDIQFFESLHYACAARLQPIDFTITTAGRVDENALGWQQHQVAMRILDQDVEELQTLVVIATAPEDLAPDDPKAWAEANPHMGITVQEPELARAAREAMDNPRRLAAFERYRLNRWKTLAADAGFNAEAFKACPRDFKPTREEYAFGAIDLSKSRDMTASAIAYVCGQRIALTCHHWVTVKQASVLETRGLPIRTWIGDGWVTVQDAETIQYAAIEEWWRARSKEFEIAEIAYDPWQALYLAQRLEAKIGATTVRFEQNHAQYNEVCGDFDSMAAEGLLATDGNPVLLWNVANARADEDPRGRAMPKKSTGLAYVDGFVSALMALRRATISELSGWKRPAIGL